MLVGSMFSPKYSHFVIYSRETNRKCFVKLCKSVLQLCLKTPNTLDLVITNSNRNKCLWGGWEMGCFQCGAAAWSPGSHPSAWQQTAVTGQQVCSPVGRGRPSHACCLSRPPGLPRWAPLPFLPLGPVCVLRQTP